MKTRCTLLSFLLVILCCGPARAQDGDAIFPEVEIRVSAEIPGFIRQECYAALRQHGEELRAKVWPYAMPAAPIIVHLLTSREFQNSMQGVPDWGVGLAWNNQVYIDCQRSPGDGRSITHILLHELAHCLIQQAAHGRADVPRWFHEGVAQQVSGEWKFRDTISLVMSGRLPNLGKLADRFPANADWADQAYRTSLLAVISLENRFGDDVVPRILRESALYGFDRGFLQATGESPATFYQTFSSSMNLRYGWPIVLTRWPAMFVLLALLFALGAVVKILRSRRRLQRMDLEAVPEVASCNPEDEERQ